jgi:hypothetical protein
MKKNKPAPTPKPVNSMRSVMERVFDGVLEKVPSEDVALSRHVRTEAGVKKFHLPIGSPIVAKPRYHGPHHLGTKLPSAITAEKAAKPSESPALPFKPVDSVRDLEKAPIGTTVFYPSDPDQSYFYKKISMDGQGQFGKFSADTGAMITDGYIPADFTHSIDGTNDSLHFGMPKTPLGGWKKPTPSGNGSKGFSDFAKNLANLQQEIEGSKKTYKDLAEQYTKDKGMTAMIKSQIANTPNDTKKHDYYSALLPKAEQNELKSKTDFLAEQKKLDGLNAEFKSQVLGLPSAGKKHKDFLGKNTDMYQGIPLDPGDKLIQDKQYRDLRAVLHPDGSATTYKLSAGWQKQDTLKPGAHNWTIGAVENGHGTILAHNGEGTPRVAPDDTLRYQSEADKIAGYVNVDPKGDRANVTTPTPPGYDSAVVYDYTSSLASAVNNVLRGRYNGDPTQYQYATARLDKSFSELNQNTLLYRSLAKFGVHKEYSPSELKDMIGTVITDKGYLSTTYNPNNGVVGGGPFIMKIRAPKGTKAIYAENGSAFPGEQEIILPRDLKLKLTAVDYTQSQYGPATLLTMEVVS